jgi:hypothetical protein
MPWTILMDAAHSFSRTAVAPLSLLWLALWPARHALLSVALILMYVHHGEPAGDEDIFTF